jgi:hypothetical protein
MAINADINNTHHPISIRKVKSSNHLFMMNQLNGNANTIEINTNFIKSTDNL